MGCAWLVSSSPSTAFVFALVSSSVTTCAFLEASCLGGSFVYFCFWVLSFWGFSALSNVM